MLISVPFLDHEQATRIRATFSADGTLVHHHPPHTTAIPSLGKACSAYQEFGWDFLDLLRKAGFEEVRAIGYRSVEYGYLGGWPLMFEARKADSPSWTSSIRQALARLLRH